MAYDDDVDLPGSSTHSLESRGKAKREALKQKLVKEGLKTAAEKQGTDLSDLKLSLLKDQVGKDKALKTAQGKSTPGGMGTKTREEQIKADKLTVDAKTSVDQLVQQARKAEKEEEEMQKEEVQGEDA